MMTRSRDTSERQLATGTLQNFLSKDMGAIDMGMPPFPDTLPLLPEQLVATDIKLPPLARDPESRFPVVTKRQQQAISTLQNVLTQHCKASDIEVQPCIVSVPRRV